MDPLPTRAASVSPFRAEDRRFRPGYSSAGHGGFGPAWGGALAVDGIIWDEAKQARRRSHRRTFARAGDERAQERRLEEARKRWTARSRSQRGRKRKRGPVETGNEDMPAVGGTRRDQDGPDEKDAGWTHWNRVCKYADGEVDVENRILVGGIAAGELGYGRKLQPNGQETKALNVQGINAREEEKVEARETHMVHAESNDELFEMDESIAPGEMETPRTHHLHHTLPFWKFGWPSAQDEQRPEDTTMNYSENRLLDIMRPGSGFEEDLAIQVKMMRNRIGSPETVQLSSEAVAARLRKEGYDARVVAKKASEGDYLRTWSHSYVVVHRGSGEEIIVEPNFAAQFQVARPTQKFKKIVDMIPLEFVGSMDRLLQVADFLATKALESLRASGLNVPPWRERDGMLSKWMSNDNFNSVRPCGKVF